MNLIASALGSVGSAAGTAAGAVGSAVSSGGSFLGGLVKDAGADLLKGAGALEKANTQGVGVGDALSGLGLGGKMSPDTIGNLNGITLGGAKNPGGVSLSLGQGESQSRHEEDPMDPTRKQAADWMTLMSFLG
jgi:hypothetical protein